MFGATTHIHNLCNSVTGSILLSFMDTFKAE